MKITKSTLKQIIKEEVVKLLVEQDEYDDYDDYDYEEEELTYAQKIIKLLISDDSANVQQGLSILTPLKIHNLDFHNSNINNSSIQLQVISFSTQKVIQ